MPMLSTQDLENNELILILAPSSLMQDFNLEALDYFLNKKNDHCVYVTVAKPYKTMMNILAKNNIKTDNIFFIDCVSQSAIPGGILRAGNCVFCEPRALTHLSIVLTQAFAAIPKGMGRVLIFDTLSTLMIYNEVNAISRFAHVLMAKLRLWGVKSVILTLEEESDKEIIAQMTQFCDKVIRG